MMEQFKDFLARVILIALAALIIFAAVSIGKITVLVLAALSAGFAIAWALDRLGMI